MTTSVIPYDGPRLSNARAPTTHAATTHKTGQSDVIANAVAAGNSGLMSGADKTKLDGLATPGAWTGYTPALTASTTNPTLGTSPTDSGRYSQIGKNVTGWVYIIFGATGMAPGSGAYYVSVPVPNLNAGGYPIGGVFLYDNSTGTTRVGVATCEPANKLTLRLDNGGLVTNAAPWTWNDSDRIRVSFTYEAA